MRTAADLPSVMSTGIAIVITVEVGEDIALGKSAAVRQVRVVSVPIVITVEVGEDITLGKSAAVRKVRVVSVPIVITVGITAGKSRRCHCYHGGYHGGHHGGKISA